MSHTTLTDTQIDARATAYSREHRVSYSEALTHVTSFAESQENAATAANSRATALVEPLTDAQIDASAKAYARDHRVSYSEALTHVVALAEAAVKQSHAATVSHASEMDRRIDAAATAHARANGASYAEALTHVTAFAASFSEGAPTVGNNDLPGSSDADAVRAMQSQPIEIFRVGTHVDSAGNTRTFTPQDVKAMAAAYDPARHEAPLTLGHPDADRPAYGWVKSLSATNDGRLLMQVDRLDKAFAEGVKASRYKKRSASFYPPLAPNNPMPGHWYLRHVGWLGAQPPAVQGLADVNFGMAVSDGAVCFGWN